MTSVIKRFRFHFHYYSLSLALSTSVNWIPRDSRKSIIGGGGQIFIYSCSASFISFESDCFYSL